jgi:large subunit ribosomal protein L11
MSKEIVEIIVEGGKASSGPAMGQSFGPLGINIQEILGEINKKTSDMKGMKIPIKVIVDTETKKFELEIGSPPISELIKKELGISKGSGLSKLDKVGNLAIEQIIKIARVKKDSMLVNNLISATKCVVGSCVPLGVLIEGKEPKEIIEEINNGTYKDMFDKDFVEINEERKKILDDQLKEINLNLSKKKAEVERKQEKDKPTEDKETSEDSAEDKKDEKKKK